ncbi:carbohydrate ABC transporter membrane protein 1 (CUT1 family) [Desmospora activa DSM 45169]|uniref:Carbohydrate ABC transporter membrane protein 1 (CUT1 family) n=2 Tax=Desmospora TaxID=500614 RepID=A0A2T4ZDH0_9BACL|nr:sugar ABC transporter permease [Desmospora activa]PTM59941.1 carbohydrate ABC transporter membrane protein 1 (CUT1 family) [Desmospora activa DSM 45169]
MLMKKGLSERNIGYLLILPALLLILVIAIYPVARSFYLSLYDIRLNDPTKSEPHRQYAIDVDRYADNLLLLGSALDREIEQAEGDAQERLTQLRGELEEVQGVLAEDPAFVERFETVDNLLLEGEDVPAELKRITIQNEQADVVVDKFRKINTILVDLNRQQALADGKRVVGLSNGLKETVIEPNFIGLQYYKDYIQDGRLWSSLNNTMVFTVISVTLELLLGLWIAMVINRQFVGRGVVRAAVLIPWALPTAVAAMMWKFLFDGQNGVMAKIFESIGLIPDMGVLLTTKFWSMFAVIFADVWKTTPFMALLILAGLQTIPRNLYEAAEVDGASKIQQFFRITLPMLRTTILVALLFRTLDAFRVFDLIYVLTGGGPANATETISVYAYKTMFAQMNFGAGSALAVIVFICVAIISMIFVRLLGRDLISDGR